MGFSAAELANSFFPHALSGAGGLIYALILLALSFALMFAGRSTIKGLAFLVAGLAGAGFGFAAGGLFLGIIGAVIGGVIGFILGGLIGVLLVNVGMGLALGYFGYLATKFLVHSDLLAIVAGVILFFIGVAISSKLLELVTAILGGIILYGVLIFFGASPFVASVISLILAAAGLYVQWTRRGPNRNWRRT
ncbi:MAG TPA: hypothetical protein VLY65_00600 [Nitrososphaerales archaeon]|nr:hypothetical protein [Nitrososphaerales archaeon]